MVPRRKLKIPPPWKEGIARPELLNKLGSALDAGCHIAMIAGAGHGKSLLLADFARSRRSAWLTLDADDADLNAFMEGLIAALDGQLPGIGTVAGGLLAQSRTREAVDAALSALFDDIDERVIEPLLLVVDDYQLAESESLNGMLERLVRNMPEPVRMVVASRTVPDVPLGNWQAKRIVAIVGEAELLFSRTELARLRPDMSAEDVDSLLRTSGGWPAGLDLSPQLADRYLEEEILQTLSAETRAYLGKIALLESFDGRIWEDVAGVPFTHELRTELIRRRLILPSAEQQYELPQMLRAFLRRQFETETPKADRVEIKRGVGWAFWEQGKPLSGLKYWCEGGEGNLAADHLARIAEDWLAQGRLAALGSALTTVLAAVDSESDWPGLLLAQGEVLRRSGEFDRAKNRLEGALVAFGGGKDSPGQAKAHLRLAQLAATRGQIEESLRFLDGARQGLADDERSMADLTNLEGGLALFQSRTAEAVKAFNQSLQLARKVGDRYAEARAAHNLGVCYNEHGDLERALASYDIAMGRDGGEPPVWMTPINRALVLIYLGRATEAEAAALAALETVRRYRLTREEGYALRILGFCQSALGAFQKAAECYALAEELAHQTGDVMGVAYSLNFRGDLAAKAGNGELALELSAKAMAVLSGVEALKKTAEFELVKAEGLAACGRIEEARTLAADLLVQSEARGHKFMAERLGDLIRRLPVSRAARLPSRSLTKPLGALEPSSEIPSTAVPELRVQCFAGFSAMRGDVAVEDKEWQTTRAKLLFLSLLHQPQGLTKSRLLEMVFPNEDPTEGALYMTLSRVRKALEPDLERARPSRFILRKEGRYVFNRQARIEVDTWSFESLLQPRPETTVSDPVANLERVLGLYRGELLPEFDADWVIAQRQRYRDRALDVCRQLLRHYEESQPGRILDIVYRALEIDPLAEDFHRELLLQFIERGEPHRALEHFRLCERRYAELLAMPPPEDLAALLTHLR